MSAARDIRLAQLPAARQRQAGTRPPRPNLQPVAASNHRRLARLAEELEEGGLPQSDGPERQLLLQEVDRALRPRVHEGRVATSGTIVNPSAPREDWGPATGLTVTQLQAGTVPTAELRRFVDGLSSWLCMYPGNEEGTVLLFDRPIGSERDLVVLAKAFQATVVQRHPSGAVRVVGPFGALRWDGLDWRLEKPVRSWLKVLGNDAGSPALEALMEFAVHDLAATGIGAVLVARTGPLPGPGFQDRLDLPPPLEVREPSHLAPLRHALAHVDGAAVFDQDGVLRRLGVMLHPSDGSTVSVAPFGGARHTSAARYSYDDPSALVIVVSEDGPVTVLKGGEVLARSRALQVAGRAPATTRPRETTATS